MRYKIEVIRRKEIEGIESFLDRILSTFKQDGEIYGGHDPVTDKWEGKYWFSYVKNGLYVKGNFNRTSETTYNGNLTLNLDSELERVILLNLPKFAPSLAKDLRASASA